MRDHRRSTPHAPSWRRHSGVLILLSSLLLAALVVAPLRGGDVALGAADRPPDVIVIMTDDQRVGTEKGMPYLWDELRPRMTYYPNAMVPNNNCCPARASFLSGQQSHTTGVWDNTASGPPGGWRQFRRSGFEQRTIATALRQRGYRTVLMGKYLNQFHHDMDPSRHRPPGWSDFRTYLSSNGGYWAPPHPIAGVPDGYTTDTLGDSAAQAIASAPRDQPLFLMVTPYAPHLPSNAGPYQGSAEAAGTLDRMRAAGEWTNPAIGEADRRDKPGFIRAVRHPARDGGTDSPFEKVRRFTRDHADTLMGVDANIRKIVEQQRAVRDWDNTLFVFLSDNGVAWGDHALFDKTTPYRLTTGIPILIKYPSWVDGRPDTDRRLINQLDVTATIADLTSASLRTQGYSAVRAPARSGMLLESPASKRSYAYWHPAYCAWRTQDALYVRYGQGAEELYDYRRDPYELANRAKDPAYAGMKHTMQTTAMTACSPVPPGFRPPALTIRMAAAGRARSQVTVTPAIPAARVLVERRTKKGRWRHSGSCRVPRQPAPLTLQVAKRGAYRARVQPAGGFRRSPWSRTVRLSGSAGTFACS